jgi:hypothetical protein
MIYGAYSALPFELKPQYDIFVMRACELFHVGYMDVEDWQIREVVRIICNELYLRWEVRE